MKTRLARLAFAALLAAVVFTGVPARAQSADPGWPRVFKQAGKQLTVYQPQVDSWSGYTNLHFRCAIAIKGVTPQEKFGVAEVDALTVTDLGARVVAIIPLKRELRFANVLEPELTQLRQAAEQLNPPGHVTSLSLDRVLAYLDPATQPVQHAVALNLDPPKIFASTTPAILVMFMGPPQFKPVDPNRTDLLFALNTNWDVFYDTASERYFLLNGEGWLTAPDALKGPWTPAQTLPPSLYSLPANEHWAEARTRLPGKPARVAPTVFTSIEPAELILTDGPPSYMPVRGTRLLHVSNTASVLFLHTGDGKLYFLVAGRWFRGGSVNGPWSASSQDLPPDFAQIPNDDPMAFVKASVPGTREAKDAVLLASIPTTTTVNLTNVTVNVTYAGPPQFVAIPSTTVQYAVNTPNQVFLVNGGYYWCSQGVWFYSVSAAGPWTFCTSVPPAIYTIPPSNPNYNVTYVVVQSATPTTVVYSQTSGYSGEFVAATGVLMFGAGMMVGAAMANNNSYYYPPPACHYSYGCSATYHYGYGGYYGASSTAYGAYGSATKSAAYNPYTGTSAASRSVNTAYGSASQSAAYNPYTGARAGSESVSTAYGSASRSAAYNPTTGNAAYGGSRSSAYGSAGAVQTSSGASAAGYSTANSQGAVAKSSSGDVYASNGDTVYKKDSDGSWSQNSGSGWTSTQSPQQQAQTQASSKQSQAQTQATTAQSQAQTKSTSAQSQAQTQATSAQSQAQTKATSTQSQAQTKSASAQSQASSAQAQRSASGSASQSASSASSSWSQNKQSMESQSQARESGNQQHQSTQSWQSSGGSRSSSYSSGSRSSSGGSSHGGRR